MFIITTIVIFINLQTHQWIAYDYNKLQIINSGIALGGMGICKETKLPKCFSPKGIFNIYAKYKIKRSDKYPIECNNKKLCGAKMYNMVKFGPKGEGIHSSDVLFPKKPINISHGCIRVSKEDSKWIYENTHLNTLIFINR